MNEKSVGHHIAEYGGYGLALAMFLFLAIRTYNFLAFTFRAEQALFAYLGLFATTIGAVIWGARYAFMKLDNGQKALALVMIVVDFMGELVLAAGDMFRVVSEKGAFNLSDGETVILIWVTAGLAAMNGIAIFTQLMHQTNPTKDGR